MHSSVLESMNCTENSHHFLIGQKGYKSGLSAIAEWLFPTTRTCANCGETIVVDAWFERNR